MLVIALSRILFDFLISGQDSIIDIIFVSINRVLINTFLS